MTVLLDAGQLHARREAMSGSLGDLSRSLANDLEPVLARELWIPPEKARMTRRGGRCEVDGTLLEFDPFSPRLHRCARCGRTFDDDSHYRWWVMWYQLWMAERAVHGAALYAVGGDPRHRDFARGVLDAYSQRYLDYPNVDNVLGPTRVFFSTYLESIWLLQLIVALDLLEASASREWCADLGARFRDRVIEPSAALIAGYDEGMSNRQVWNNAALLAAARSVGGSVGRLEALTGPSGLTTHLTSGLLPDGTWYEGENYHLFAHRGLWYGVTIATAAGVELDRRLVARFDEAFATPFMTALPDFTFPSRRDSQYAVTLRQWRFAELAELGLARQPHDRRLLGALATLYDGSVDRYHTERDRSTAEAERNTPPTSLGRSDLGWRSLLFALPMLPPLERSAPTSVLMEGQGLAILRRDHGALYAALDYGHSGAGHGHPDRLNVILARGNDRWLDDVGTGSYVDPSLHWYRSTLAHNAPLVDGRSQARVHGVLVAYDDRGEAGWVRARVSGVAPGVRLQRTLVAMSTYLIDVLTWDADRDVQIDLPFHIDATFHDVEWTPATPDGGSELEDGFSFLTDTAVATSASRTDMEPRLHAPGVDGSVHVEGPHTWWRGTSYGPPGAPPRRFHFVRTRGLTGRIVTVWDVADDVRARTVGRDVTVTLRDGSTHRHSDHGNQWRVDTIAAGAPRTIELRGSVSVVDSSSTDDRAARNRSERQPWRIGRALDRVAFELGEANYWRSELSWNAAGRPTAVVTIGVENDALSLFVAVNKRDVCFAPRRDSNPLDNEPPDINSDGVQLHLVVDDPQRAPAPRELAYVMVPELGGTGVRVTSRSSSGSPPVPTASWENTPGGYSVRVAIGLRALGLSARSRFLVGVAVNDMAPDRERRRGQLVLGESNADFVYLRGDRLPIDRHLSFVIADA